MRTSRKGFTLVELLAVIAILALLAAVSFGVIMSGIKFAQTAKCSENMRSIGVCFQSYLSDHNYIMPQRFYPDSPGSHDGVAYYDLLAPYTGDNNASKAESVFICPVHTACSFPLQPSYGMNWYYDNARYTDVPSNTIMVAEADGPDGTGSNRADEDSQSPGELAPSRHGSGSNYLFFDGRVAKLPYAATVNLWGVDLGNHSQSAPSP